MPTDGGRAWSSKPSSSCDIPFADPFVTVGHNMRLARRSKGCGRCSTVLLSRGLANGHDIERRDRSLETLERELPGRFHVDVRFDLGEETLRDQDLTGGGLVSQPGGEVRHGADRSVVRAAFEADLP